MNNFSAKASKSQTLLPLLRRRINADDIEDDDYDDENFDDDDDVAAVAVVAVDVGCRGVDRRRIPRG